MPSILLTTPKYFLFSYHAHLIYPMLNTTPNGPTSASSTKCEFLLEFHGFYFIDADLKKLRSGDDSSLYRSSPPRFYCIWLREEELSGFLTAYKSSQQPLHRTTKLMRFWTLSRPLLRILLQPVKSQRPQPLNYASLSPHLWVSCRF
jgi:hypothetical protein